MSKQLGRPAPIDLDEDEPFLVTDEVPAIPNDPARPRVTSMAFEKQGERFKYEPQDSIDEQPELYLPADVKPAPKEKVLFKMDKGPERFPTVQKSIAVDFDIMGQNDGQFRGTDLADLQNAFKATLPNLPVVDFSKYQGTTKHRVDLPWPKGERPEDRKAKDDDD